MQLYIGLRPMKFQVREFNFPDLFFFGQNYIKNFLSFSNFFERGKIPFHYNLYLKFYKGIVVSYPYYYAFFIFIYENLRKELLKIGFI